MGFLDVKDFDVDPKKLPRILLYDNVIWLFVVVLILGISLFRFPIQENMFGKVEIYHYGIPIKINAKYNGELNLFVKDQERVSENQHLGFYNWNIDKLDFVAISHLAKFYFESQRDSSVLKLQTLLENLKTSEVPFLQGEISAIVTSLELYINTVQYSSFDLYMKSQKKRISSLQNNKKINQTIVGNRHEQNKLILGHIKADSILYVQGILSQREYELRKRDYIEGLLRIDEGTLSIEATDETIQGIHSSIELGKYELELKNLEHYQILLTALSDYKKEYYKLTEEKEITAPISGTVHFADILNYASSISEGTEILTIQPLAKEPKSIARIITQSRGSGRVKVGSKVMIMLDEFPIDKFGVVYGKISTRHEITQNNKYIFDIQLNDGLTTSYDITLHPRPQLTGNGTILLNRTSIFELIKNEMYAKKEIYISKG